MSKGYTNLDVAEEVRQVATFDPGLGAYTFGNLGDVVQFANLMSRAGEILPPHLRDRPALCLAVTMRAMQWKIDPFGLAAESYQAQQGGVIGYQAKVFVAALRQVAGIQLCYEYSGSFEIRDEPVKSANGKTIAPRRAVGDRRCRAFWVDPSGHELEYETMPLDQITVKNSPLWHNDPDQQLAYYAGRGWARRHRPDVIMGAFATEELEDVREDRRRMRDVTPTGGFAQLAQRAREAADRHDAAPAEPSGDHEESARSVPTVEIDEQCEDYQAGRATALEGMFGRADCPHKEDPVRAQQWFAGFDSVEIQDAEG